MIHCINHNLELAIGDLRKHDADYLNFDETMRDIYSMFHFSIKKSREILKVANELEEEFVAFSSLQTIRWLASQFRAVEKFYKNYSILCPYLEHASVAKDKNEEDKARARGIYSRVTSLKFALWLNFLMDFLPPLKLASLDFQNEDMFLPTVTRKLKQLKQSILALKNGNGPHMRSFIAKFQNGSWRGVELNRTAGLGPITRQKLRQLRVDEAMQKQVAETKNQFEVEEPPVAKDERSAQEIMFNKFNSFVDDAVFYVNQRFEAFLKNPLKSFSIFDYKGFG